MNMIPVISGHVSHIGYDAPTKTLGVKFKNGGLYHYSDVPPERFQSLKTAGSVGAHLATHIKGKHPEKLV